MARAQALCTSREALLKMIDGKYHERRVAMGMAGDQVMELWASASGTWTLTASRPSGLTCIAGAGQGFKLLDTPNPEATGEDL